MGRLSNPAEPLETLVGGGASGSNQVQEKASRRSKGSSSPSSSGAPENLGRLSNPLVKPAGEDSTSSFVPTSDRSAPSQIQRRLRTSEVDELVAAYQGPARVSSTLALASVCTGPR